MVRLTYLEAEDRLEEAVFASDTGIRIFDCGINVASEDKPYPYLDAPEFNINDLDAVILSHAHVDHCGFIPYLLNMVTGGLFTAQSQQETLQHFYCLIA